MRGMILAAGRGERMGQLTQNVPKPLLRLGGYYLIEYSLFAFAAQGIKEVVINTCYRAEQIKNALGDGSRYGVSILYSDEKEALETGGGIFQALPLLGDEPFIVLSCDVVTDFDLKSLPTEPEGLAHLVMVNNPAYHPNGDFCLQEKKLYRGEHSTLTFSNIGLYRPELFARCKPGKFRLGALLRDVIDESQVSGQYYNGIWYNLGTPKEADRVTALPDIR